ADAPASAFSATASSTEEAATFASIPAAFSFSSNSLLERPCSLAISCTRFLLTGSPILRAWDRRSPTGRRSSSAGRDRSRHAGWRARGTWRPAGRLWRRGRGRPPGLPSWHSGPRPHAPSADRRRGRPRCATAPTSARSAHSRRNGVAEAHAPTQRAHSPEGWVGLCTRRVERLCRLLLGGRLGGVLGGQLGYERLLGRYERCLRLLATVRRGVLGGGGPAPRPPPPR